MSDDKKSGAAAWTELEKLDLIMQLVDLVKPVPWKQLRLPAGRTQKACSVMLDKEKSKWKKSKAEDEGEAAAEPATSSSSKGKKRDSEAVANAEDKGDASNPKTKKAKQASKKKTASSKKIVKAGADKPMDASPSEAEAGAATAEVKSEVKDVPEEEDAPMI